MNSAQSDDEQEGASYNPKPETRREILETGQDLDATAKFDRRTSEAVQIDQNRNFQSL